MIRRAWTVLKIRLKSWLDIEPAAPVDENLRADIDKQIQKLTAELDYWKNTFRKYSRVPCGNCGEEMHVYPFGGAYYTANGVKVHAACYDEYLKKVAK